MLRWIVNDFPPKWSSALGRFIGYVRKTGPYVGVYSVGTENGSWVEIYLTFQTQKPKKLLTIEGHKFEVSDSLWWWSILETCSWKTHTQIWRSIDIFCQYTWFFQCNASPLRGSKPSTAEWQHLDFAWWVLPLSNPLVVHCTGEELSALDPTGHSLAPLERL